MPRKKTLPYENLKKIEKTFQMIGGDKCLLGLTLLNEASFCGKTLTELKKAIEEEGIVDDMCQGNYSIKRESPSLKSYNTLIKNYQSLIKQINDLLGEQPKGNEPDELEKFINQ